MTDVRITHIGGPTVLIEVGGLRVLTDPTFDPPGGDYRFGWGTGSTKLAGPAVAPTELPPIDVILLTHDHHDDNLDTAGRELLPAAGVVVTTASGARRLGNGARGLRPWERTIVGSDVRVTATPCRHGPPLSRPIVGEVVGFSLHWDEQAHGELWISGDTVLFDGVREVADRLDVGTVLLHLGDVHFPVTGPLHYTMTAREGIELCTLVEPTTVIPVHYEGWKHFREGRDAVEQELESAPARVRDAVRWLEPGVAATISV